MKNTIKHEYSVWERNGTLQNHNNKNTSADTATHYGGEWHYWVDKQSYSFRQNKIDG